MAKWKMLREAVAVGAITGLVAVPIFLCVQIATTPHDPRIDQLVADYQHYLERRDQYPLRDQRLRDYLFEWRMADLGVIEKVGRK